MWLLISCIQKNLIPKRIISIFEFAVQIKTSNIHQVRIKMLYFVYCLLKIWNLELRIFFFGEQFFSKDFQDFFCLLHRFNEFISVTNSDPTALSNIVTYLSFVSLSNADAVRYVLNACLKFAPLSIISIIESGALKH